MWLTSTKRRAWCHPWCFFSVKKTVVKHSYAEFLQELRLGSCTTARLNQWPGSILTPVKENFKTVHSSGKVMVYVFRNDYGVLLVDFTPPNSTISAATYQETLNSLKGVIWKRDQDCWQQELFFCVTVLNLRVLSQLWTSGTPGAGKFFYIHHTVLIWHHRTSISSKRWQSTSEISDSTSVKMLKI
jgi:hypothetical protein